jgi:hypothetical protein
VTRGGGVVVAQIGLLVLAVGLAFVGVQGLRGKPDSDGKTTPKSVAVVTLILAAGLAAFALVVLPRFAGPGGW